MRKHYSQITFEFQDPSDSDENAGVGVRIKSLKKAAAEKTVQEPDPDKVQLTEVHPEIDDRHPEQHHQVEANINTENLSDDFSTDNLSDDNTLSAASSEDLAGEAFDPQFSTRSTEVITKEELTDRSIDSAPMTDEREESNTTVIKPAKSTRGRKSLKTIDDGTELINIPPDEELFKKQYYAIGEVAEMFQVNQSLLRFWETEFDIIQPRKNRKGDRHFRPIDIKNLLLIHDLLRRRKLTIEGAKDFLKKNKRTPERFAMIQSLQKIRGFMLEIKTAL